MKDTKAILIDKVPAGTWARLKAQAALEQKTFSDFMREKLETLSARCSVQSIEKK